MLTVVVQFLSHVQILQPWTTARQAPFTLSQSLLKFMSTELVLPSNQLIFGRPLLLLPSIFPSIIRVFSNESALRIRWPKYYSFSFNISPSNEHPGLISFRMDGLDLLAVQQLQGKNNNAITKANFFKNMKYSSIWERFGSLFYLQFSRSVMSDSAAP